MLEELEMDDLSSFYAGGSFGDDDAPDLGFVDLLGGFQNSIFDLPPPPPPANSLSPSSSSTEASESPATAGDEVEGKERINSKKGRCSGEVEKRKIGKKGQKRQRQPRFAFMTKSEVEHLEDGYRWRKYGQKAVKNSPFPRSYYRCTSANCGVKKRVERSCEDTAVVVTTYEGQHTHASPVGDRRAPVALQFPANSPFSVQDSQHLLLLQQQQQHTQLCFPPPPAIPEFGFAVQRPVLHPPNATGRAVRDFGLLQDMVPSDMMNQKE